MLFYLYQLKDVFFNKRFKTKIFNKKIQINEIKFNKLCAIKLNHFTLTQIISNKNLILKTILMYIYIYNNSNSNN